MTKRHRLATAASWAISLAENSPDQNLWEAQQISFLRWPKHWGVSNLNSQLHFVQFLGPSTRPDSKTSTQTLSPFQEYSGSYPGLLWPLYDSRYDLSRPVMYVKKDSSESSSSAHIYRIWLKREAKRRFSWCHYWHSKTETASLKFTGGFNLWAQWHGACFDSKGDNKWT